MGTDIHMVAEYRDATTDEWELVTRHAPSVLHTDGAWCPYDERSYHAFAMLADVRNEHGFVPISPPRGLPYDISHALSVLHEQEYVLGDHSCSWITLRELLEYDWDQRVTITGLVNGPQYHEWTRHGRDEGELPQSYCKGAFGPTTQHVDNAEMDRRIADIASSHHSFKQVCEHIARELEFTFTPFAQVRTYGQCALRFFGSVVPPLLAIAHREAGGDYDAVRIIFGFDS